MVLDSATPWTPNPSRNGIAFQAAQLAPLERSMKKRTVLYAGILAIAAASLLAQGTPFDGGAPEPPVCPPRLCPTQP